jgi:hypothetical protein
MGPQPSHGTAAREQNGAYPRLLFCSVPSLIGTDGTLFLAVPAFPVFPSFDRMKR